MKYDFENPANRVNTDSWKWDFRTSENELPMWIADMDFKVAPEITEALIERAKVAAYGYTFPSHAFFDAWRDFMRDRHGFEMEEEKMIFACGVIPIISSSVRKITKEGEGVLLMTPIYNTFFNSIVNNNRIPVMCPMDYVGGEFYVDYEKLGAMLSDPKVTMMILCNPHNPLGRIWNKEELAHIGKLAKKNNVVVLSDEVHGELTAPGKTYIPFASVNEECRNNSIACLSTSKCFNMAAIHSAIAYVPNVELYEKINRALNTDEVAEPNFFAGVGAIAALNNGREWLDEVRTVIQNNRDLLEKFIQKELPELHVIHGEATYLIFVDCSSLCEEASILTEHLRKTTGLWVQSGEVYRGNGKSFFRINVATPEKVLRDGLRRLKEGVESFKKRNHS